MNIDKTELQEVLKKHGVSESEKLAAALAEYFSNKILSIDEIDRQMGERIKRAERGLSL